MTSIRQLSEDTFYATQIPILDGDWQNGEALIIQMRSKQKTNISIKCLMMVFIPILIWKINRLKLFVMFKILKIILNKIAKNRTPKISLVISKESELVLYKKLSCLISYLLFYFEKKDEDSYYNFLTKHHYQNSLVQECWLLQCQLKMNVV